MSKKSIFPIVATIAVVGVVSGSFLTNGLTRLKCKYKYDDNRTSVC